jgi:hypothetical protein
MISLQLNPPTHQLILKLLMQPNHRTKEIFDVISVTQLHWIENQPGFNRKFV